MECIFCSYVDRISNIDMEVSFYFRPYPIGLLGMIKFSICYYMCGNWYYLFSGYQVTSTFFRGVFAFMRSLYIRCLLLHSQAVQRALRGNIWTPLLLRQVAEILKYRIFFILQKVYRFRQISRNFAQTAPTHEKSLSALVTIDIIHVRPDGFAQFTRNWKFRIERKCISTPNNSFT